MKKVLFTLFAVVAMAAIVNAQTIFAEQIEAPEGFDSPVLVVPQSPLTTQILFIGGTDMVQTTETYGNPAGETPAKEWHDFIGFTPDNDSDDLGWVSINHERIQANDMIGDGGGMTVFKVRRDPVTDTLIIVEQTIVDDHLANAPTRTGKFFNVDFVNTVGETGMNCGGITSIVDGRIWTAEEWFRGNTGSIYADGNGVRDTAKWVIDAPDFPAFDGLEIDKYQNFNYMVEIDPKKARAIRKQYNFGRQGFEGGAISLNNKRMYLGPDVTGNAFFGMFIADEAGDFTKGTLYAYKHDKPGYKWVPIYGGPDVFLNHLASASAAGATAYNRIEWVCTDPKTGDIYWTETGNDDPGDNFARAVENGATYDPYHDYLAQLQGLESAVDTTGNFQYADYFGRVWYYDVSADTMKVAIEGGAGVTTNKHLSNPDGLSIMTVGEKRFLVIQEDLNGSSQGRVPEGTQSRTCELWLLDMDIENPTVDDLLRLAVVPAGAEVTGAQQTSDGKTLLVNAQHPSSSNPFPYNHSFTFAIHGFDKLTSADLVEPTIESRNFELNEEAFTVYPNPTTRMVYFNETTDAALYNAEGKRVKVVRNANSLDVSALAAGTYFLQNAKGETITLSIQ